jgi:hypothetical protein
MKTRCRHCVDWVAWSRAEGRWYHIDNGKALCSNGRTFATRDPSLPLVALTAADQERLRS